MKKVSRAKFFSLEKELAKQHFRVAIFGSARIKSSNSSYKEVYKVAEALGEMGVDVVSGGGPGLMDAANKGHEIGRKKMHNGETHSYGLTIKLPQEQRDNRHFDMKKDFQRFSARLDYFMQLSNAVVVAPGGVGTLLEFLYTWQLVQVEHVYDIPIIMLGEQWKSLIEWIKKGPLKHGLLKESDLDSIYVVKNADEAVKILKASYQMYKNSKKFKHGYIGEYIKKN